MTKEELEKEVEEYLENKYCENVCTCDEVEECKRGIRIRCMSFDYKKTLIINFAEPREKRIAELETENEKLRGFEHIVQKMKDNGFDTFMSVKEFLQEHRELKEENAELKHQLTHRNCVDCSNHSSKLRMRNSELEKANDMQALRIKERDELLSELKAQIEKMKDCINDLVHLGEFNEDTDEDYTNYLVHEALKNAEQFLKE